MTLDKVNKLFKFLDIRSSSPKKYALYLYVLPPICCLFSIVLENSHKFELSQDINTIKTKLKKLGKLVKLLLTLQYQLKTTANILKTIEDSLRVTIQSTVIILSGVHFSLNSALFLRFSVLCAC